MFNRVYTIPLALAILAGTIETGRSFGLVPQVESNPTHQLISQRYGQQTLRAVSGPDDQGRWRFYKPDGVSDSAMRSQGCINVGSRVAQPWRCPRERIRVEVRYR